MSTRGKSGLNQPLTDGRISVRTSDFANESILNVDFSVLPLVCIVGPNGVGKSTLLLLLTGKLNPVSVKMLYKKHFLKIYC